tara:strand:+ start:472 stop:1623 length:1152 start_codon:yes stop_codon:yes gene_type:complete
MKIKEDKPLSVSLVNTNIKNILENNILLQDIWIEGELSNVKFYAKGNQLYFNLTDGKATINCVIYSQFLRLLTFQPKDGLAIFARGKIKVFQNKGTYIFQVAFLSLDGIGKNNLAFEELKKKLTQEGLFNQEFKKDLPPFPKSIAVITSPDSAAMWDFVTTTRKEFGYFTLTIIPAVMQGVQASMSIIEALNKSESYEFDLVVIIRGGGSQEDLSCFNDELLIRRVFHHKTPIIVGIGHEVDLSLLDLVADKSCSTPTAVAKDILTSFEFLKNNLIHYLNFIHNYISILKTELLDETHFLLDTLQRNVGVRLKDVKSTFDFISKQLAYSNPLHQLEKGYSIVTTDTSNLPVKSVKDVKINDSLQIKVFDGIINSSVKGTIKDA